MEDSPEVPTEAQEVGGNLQAAILARGIDSVLGKLTTFLIGQGTIVTTNNMRLML